MLSKGKSVNIIRYDYSDKYMVHWVNHIVGWVVFLIGVVTSPIGIGLCIFPVGLLLMVVSLFQTNKKHIHHHRPVTIVKEN